MARSVDDPHLGVLERRRGRWWGEVEIDGDRVTLAVVGGRAGPESAALAVARGAADELGAARTELEEALADHREPWGTTEDRWSIEWASVAAVDGVLTLELGLQVAWDDDHTLGARLRRGQLLELNGSVLGP